MASDGLSFIGYHVCKKPSLSETVKILDPEIPYQIFMHGPSTVHFNVDDEDLAKTRKIVKKNGLRIFVHSAYLVNLCRTEEYTVPYLGKLLKCSRKAGFLGVVVHSGKQVKMKKAEALENMARNLIQASEFASPECPLLVETPAGQGTELLSNPKSLKTMITKLDLENLGICVDSCHVFAAGFDPLETVKDIEKTGFLKLIHFNDSQGEMGSRIDRHAFAGHGFIGPGKMEMLMEWIELNRIPAVIE
jgi:deoxyribonuclease IV